MSRNKMSGFTLIELMVVIVIIGVLASLAIPRFTEASLKAKAAEAPRIIASFESAYLTAVAEEGSSVAASDETLIFKLPTAGDSKWWGYTYEGAGLKATASGALSLPQGTMGELTSTYAPADDKFTHTCGTGMKKFAPNFGCRE